MVAEPTQPSFNAKRELDEMRLTLSNIEQRKGEARSALESDIEKRRAEIQARHVAEQMQLRKDFTPRQLDETIGRI